MLASEIVCPLAEPTNTQPPFTHTDHMVFRTLLWDELPSPWSYVIKHTHWCRIFKLKHTQWKICRFRVETLVRVHDLFSVRLSVCLNVSVSWSSGVSGATERLAGSGSPGTLDASRCPSEAEWCCRARPPMSRLKGRPTAPGRERSQHPENPDYQRKSRPDERSRCAYVTFVGASASFPWSY